MPAREKLDRLAVAITALALVTTAILFPGSTSGGLALIALVAGAGIMVAWVAWVAWVASRAAWCDRPTWPGPLVSIGIVLVASTALFGEIWRDGSGWVLHDWGSHHALVRAMIDGLRDGHMPQWLHGVSTGDSAYETYPAFVYHVIAAIAILFDIDNIPLLLQRVAIAVQVLWALATMQLARRVAAWPLALIIGLIVLIDRASGTAGGSREIFYWGMVHASVAQIFIVLIFTAILDAMSRPSLGHSVRIWLYTALAMVAHPMSLIAVLGGAMALVVVLFLATDIPRYRALAALGHLVLGAALAAFVWIPLSERILLHSLHYAAAPVSLWQKVSTFVARAIPDSSFGPILYAGYGGLVVGLLSRRAAPTFLAMLAVTFMLGTSDHLYALLGIDASPRMARFPSDRLQSLAKPALHACAAYAGTLACRYIVGVWRGAAWRRTWDGSSYWLLGVIGALASGFLLRGCTPFLDQHLTALRNDLRDAVPDQASFARMIEWARGQAATMRPEAFGRLYSEDANQHLVHHIQAESGLPVFYLGAQSAVLLRERIENDSDDSLRRFNVRWVVRHGTPPRAGDPATEIVFGEWRIREITSWDGRFARVERGEGEAVITQLANHRVVVELRGTDRPALVALGTGFYPRWRARREDGRSLPVYAMPAVAGGSTHVVAAWLPPGRSVFTPDGPLPSDGKGLLLSALALLLVVAIEVVWSRTRWRSWVLRHMARAWQKARNLVGSPSARPVLALAVAGTAVALLLAGAARTSRTASALAVGSGLTGDAIVQARSPGGKWQDCAYLALRGGYSCRWLLFVEDGRSALINDSPVSWPYLTPSVKLWNRTHPRRPVEFRILAVRQLGGIYFAASQGGPVSVAVSDAPDAPVSGQTQLDLGPSSQKTVTIQGIVRDKSLTFTLVRADTLDPERGYRAPPDEPPAELLGR